MRTIQAHGAQQPANPIIGSIHRLSVGCLLLTACLAAAQGKPDLSTPLAAAKTYYAAMKNANAKTMENASTGTPERKHFMAMLMRACTAYDKVDRAAAAKFGRQQTDEAFHEIKASCSLPAATLAALTDCQVKIQGTKATLTFKPNKAGDTSEPLELQQTTGEWKILLGADIDKSDFNADAMAALAKSMEQCATDIPNGKYKSADEAKQGMMSAMMNQVSQTPDRQATEGKPERAGAEPRISAAEAAKHYNETLIVTGQVNQVNFRPTIVYLNLDKPYPDTPFMAVVFAKSTNSFGDLSRFKGKHVEIKGTIKEYRGKPEIVLQETNQLRVVGDRAPE